MRKSVLFAMLALSLFTSPLMASDKPDSANACWKPAFKAGDADAVANCYATDAVFWLGGAPIMKGRDAIRQGYADFFAESTIKSMELVEMGRITGDDEMATWGTYTLVTVSKKDGAETTGTGRYTDVQKKIDGNWVYLVDHASDDPPPAPAE